jgi:hypothetical protein
VRQATPQSSSRAGPAARRGAAGGSLSDAGGLLTLINVSQLRVDGVAYAGGDPELGSSTSFA